MNSKFFSFNSYTSLFTFLFVLTCFFPSQSKAQLTGFEISAGGRMTALSNSTSLRNSISTLGENDKLGGDIFSKLHYNLGTKFLKISPELFFIQNGDQEVHSNISSVSQGVTERNIKMDYGGISIPLSLSLPIGKNKSSFSGIEIAIGGFADYAIDESITDNDNSPLDISFKEQADKIDYGISTGIGIFIQGIVLRAGYDYGLKEIEFAAPPMVNGIAPEAYNVRNTGFSFTVGFVRNLNETRKPSDMTPPNNKGRLGGN